MGTVCKAREQRFQLYKAVKYEVEEYAEDCGYTLAELWSIIQKDDEKGKFWRRAVVTDYEEVVRR